MSLQDLYDLTNFNLELIQETEFWKIKKKKTIIALFKRAAYSNSKFSWNLCFLFSVERLKRIAGHVRRIAGGAALGWQRRFVYGSHSAKICLHRL